MHLPRSAFNRAYRQGETRLRNSQFSSSETRGKQASKRSMRVDWSTVAISRNGQLIKSHRCRVWVSVSRPICPKLARVFLVTFSSRRKPSRRLDQRRRETCGKSVIVIELMARHRLLRIWGRWLECFRWRSSTLIGQRWGISGSLFFPHLGPFKRSCSNTWRPRPLDCDV